MSDLSSLITNVQNLSFDITDGTNDVNENVSLNVYDLIEGPSSIVNTNSNFDGTHTWLCVWV